MGQGAFAGIPLQLAGIRKILEFMDWGDYGAKGTFINIGALGLLPTYSILRYYQLSNKMKYCKFRLNHHACVPRSPSTWKSKVT